MNEFMKEKIKAMDVKSDEFWDIYCFVADKYFAFDEPDEFQKCAMLCHQYLSKSCENYEHNVIIMVKIIEQLYGMDPLKGGASMLTLTFKEFLYTVKITSDPKKMDDLEDILGKALKGMEDGTIEVKDSAGKNKSPFGKKFFK